MNGGAVVALLVIGYLLTRGAVMGIAVKPGVQLATTWQVETIRRAVERIFSKHGLQVTITSGLDGEHMANSKHYEGLAEDYRTHDIPDHLKYQIFNEIRVILGTDYQVIFEYEGLANEHLHIEYDPK